MMWLLTAWGGVKRVFRLVLDYPLQAALIVAVLACGYLYMGKERALATIAKRDATIVQMEAASKIATAAQKALNKQVTDQQTQIAKDADNDQTTRRDIADRSSRYADGMRAENYCRKASAAPEDNSAGIDTSPRDTSIVVSEADFRILTANTARLMDVRAWGQKLIDEGLAEPAK